MKNILVLGSSGMLGSMVLKVLSKNKNLMVSGTSRKPFTNSVRSDLSKIFPDSKYLFQFDVHEIINPIFNSIDYIGITFNHNYDYIINCIGITKPYIKDEKDKYNAIMVNSIFSLILNDIAKKYNFKVIQIATDCVFDGKKGNYIETDSHDSGDVYGKTKSLGEIVSDNYLNLRCSILGPEIFHKSFLLEWILNLKDGDKVQGYKNHFWNGITTYHFSKIVDGIINNDEWFNGIQHIVPYNVVSKDELLRIIVNEYGKDIEIDSVNKEIGMDMTLSTNNYDKNTKLWMSAGFDKVPTIKEMIKNLKEWS